MKALAKIIGLIAIGFISISCLVSCIPIRNVSFVNEACIIPYKQYEYHTCAPMYFNVDGETYVVPKNFKTDLASIPKPLWSFISPQYTPYVAPAILHDYLYSCGNLFDRRIDDEILYSALRLKGVSRYTAAKFYYAVRLFGGKHFNERNDVCLSVPL